MADVTSVPVTSEPLNDVLEEARFRYAAVLDVDLELGNRWMWNGPGADGDTMERIRKL